MHTNNTMTKVTSEVTVVLTEPYRYIFTDHFSDSGKAIGSVSACVPVCVSGQ